MRVLVMESNPGKGEDLAEQLTDAGHEVTRCHDDHAPAFPCNALLDGRECPMDRHQVDVAVFVQDPTSAAGRSADEDGVRCALRRQIPVVIAGDSEESLYESWAAATTDSTDAIVPTIEAVAHGPMVRHEHAALKSFRAVLVIHDLDPSQAIVDVRRHDGAIAVRLDAGVPVEKSIAEMAAVRVAGAVRDIDPYADRISVSVD